jgi:hypothetical protein
MALVLDKFDTDNRGECDFTKSGEGCCYIRQKSLSTGLLSVCLQT